jgi:hypothetical protein
VLKHIHEKVRKTTQVSLSAVKHIHEKVRKTTRVSLSAVRHIHEKVRKTTRVSLSAVKHILKKQNSNIKDRRPFPTPNKICFRKKEMTSIDG